MALPILGKRIEQFFFAAIISLPILLGGMKSGLGVNTGLIISFFLVAGYILVRYNVIKDPHTLFVRSVFGIVYVGFLSAHLLLLYQLEHGNLWIIYLSAVTAGSDTGAYYVGRLFGKHKLCPQISPKKTIEGAIGGIVGGVLCSLVFGWLLLPAENLVLLACVAAVLVVVGIGGDLTESILKRYHGIKDSGTILAGHGGILDRADSILFAAPLLYYFLLL